MRRFCLCLLALFLVVDGRAAQLAGVTLPDSVQVGDARLVLNGLGLRKKFVVKVYVAGLYLSQKSSDPRAILAAHTPKRIVMHFVHDVSKQQLRDAFDDSFDDNARDARKAAQSEIERFFAALDSVKEGDQMTFTYVPGTGTTYAVNGKDKLVISGPAFASVLLSVWLGPKPPNDELKKGMLGM